MQAFAIWKPFVQLEAFRSSAIQLTARLMRGGTLTTKTGKQAMRGTLTLRAFICLLLPIAVLAAGAPDPARAQQQEKRIALVVGNGAYAKSQLATTANDAGLIAQTLQAAGFD